MSNTSHNFSVVDDTSGFNGSDDGVAYTGPIAGLEHQFIDITPHTLSVTADTPNSFIHAGDGTSAIDVVASGVGASSGEDWAWAPVASPVVSIPPGRRLTRLAKTPEKVQEGLINWGYVICDTAMRSHVDKGEAPGPALPYP